MSDLCSNIDVEDFLDCLGIERVTKATAEEWLFSCPFPGHSSGDDKPSAYMNDETTAFFCHACHSKGNAISFTAKLLGVSNLTAIGFLRERYHPQGLNPDAVSMTEVVEKIRRENNPPPPPRNQLLDPALLERYAVDWEAAHAAWKAGEGHPACDYMFERGFEPETLDYWDFGYDPDTDRVTFAVYDVNGGLIGFKGRAYQEGHHPKYMVLGDAPLKNRFGYPRYFPSQNLFGLHEAMAELEILEYGQPGHLILCEGELDVVAMWQKGWRGCVAVSGSHFSVDHRQMLVDFCDEVTLFFDTDKAGKGAVYGSLGPGGEWEPGIIDLLKHHIRVKIVPPHDGDPASMSIDEIVDCLSNAKSHLQLLVSDPDYAKIVTGHSTT